MKVIKTILLTGIILTGALLFGQQYSVGDSVANFTVPVCANGSGTWALNDYNGALNGDEYHVIFVDIYKSW